ncbi:HAD family hydrolase [Acidipropionibacterium timonense]|uniref:HAD family hydrolase n=1 Tax=Acidipropionibacterium timonense TaxID=2161818 RepID=UPI001030F4F4|nr:beta-phosphoglucomutase family hydrolase [Acidipropionibacterium timonense]
MDLSSFTAFLFDLDGVLTPTARVHRRAWAEMFDAVLADHGDPRPFSDADYLAHVDGRPRYDGVRDFLASRGITLPEGTPEDPADATTVCGLGNRKNELFLAVLARDGIEPYPGSLRLVRQLVDRHVDRAVVSASRNARQVLDRAGLTSFFDVIVDGQVAQEQGLAGKPAPDPYLAAASMLSRAPGECVVVEDAVSGVRSGAAAGAGLVVGVDRGAGPEALRAAGAQLVVADLEELVS